MRKHAETLNAIKGYKLTLLLFITTSPVSKQKLEYTFQTLFARERGLSHPYFL